MENRVIEGNDRCFGRFRRTIPRKISEMFGKYIRFLPSGKRVHNYGKSPFSIGKSTISMAIFNSYVSLPEGRCVEIAPHLGFFQGPAMFGL